MKPECLQQTGSFKFRGAWSALSALEPEARAKGVIAYSSGNHAQGVAYMCRHFGKKGVIFMPVTTPDQKIAAFLSDAGWSDATREPLAGDASSRRYTRLRRGEDRAILMQDPDGDTALFARLSRHLLSLGLSAPRILAEAPGLLLLEDLGDGLIARLATDPETEKRLYLTATDALIALHQHAPPADLPEASPQYLAVMTDLAFTAVLTLALLLTARTHSRLILRSEGAGLLFGYLAYMTWRFIQ